MQDRPIIRLNEEIIGKIAAGEVVESPASAVKELVENSLDAGATCVTVEIRDGGISYLRVTDNGRGIPARDVRLAFERHATSKIRKSEDLFDLHTLGFRGEALASIAAVSKLVLTTRNVAEETGTRAVVEGGVIKSITEAASPQGTTIVVKELFYNTPVRLKFLKKPVAEAARVADAIAKLILAHPEISFRLIHNGKQIYSSSGNGELRSAVFCLYGRECANAMVPVKSEGAIAVSGLVGVGLQARSNRGRQTFIVNGRTIRSQLLSLALEEGCRERVTIGHYPICVLNIDMPVGMVDVNVHPNKLEVRFSDEKLIGMHVKNAVEASFASSMLSGAPELLLTQDSKRDVFRPGVVRVIETDTPDGLAEAKRETQGASSVDGALKPAVSVPAVSEKEDDAVGARASEVKQETMKPPVMPESEQQEAFKSFVTQYFGGAALRESVVPGTATIRVGIQDKREEREPLGEDTRRTAQTTEAAQTVPEAADEQKKNAQAEQQSMLEQAADSRSDGPLAGYRMVGVAFDTYIILQNDKQLLLIDQHAAHERILYEKLMKEINRGGGSQVLLVSQIVQVTPQDSARIEQYAQEIREAGFEIEPFGDHAYKLLAVPNVLGVPQSRSAFLEMVDHLGELRVLSTQKKRRDAILQMACKRAIKGGDKLTMEEIEPLLAQMLATNSPPTCPHGRPLIVTLTRTELEKRFRRIND